MDKIYKHCDVYLREDTKIPYLLWQDEVSEKWGAVWFTSRKRPFIGAVSKPRYDKPEDALLSKKDKFFMSGFEFFRLMESYIKEVAGSGEGA